MRRTTRSLLRRLALTPLAALALLACDAVDPDARARAKADPNAAAQPLPETPAPAPAPAPKLADAGSSGPADQWALDGDAPSGGGGGELNNVTIETSSAGAWVIRRGQGRSGLGGLDGLMAAEAAPMDSGGLGLVGTGRGGGGTGEGSIGLGSIGTIGHGAGGGKGSGYGSGAGAAKRAKPRRSAPSGRPRPSPSVAQSSPLKAGATDDNADFKAFLTYLEKTRERADLRDVYQDVDVRQRRFIVVKDRDGNPLPGARIAVVDPASDRAGWRATTYGDGVAPFYPAIGFPENSQRPSASYRVEVDYGGTRSRVDFNTAEERVSITLDTTRAPLGSGQGAPLTLEVVFLIDTTGSMGDEIAQIKATLLNVSKRLQGLQQRPDLRYAAVLFRDLGDAYVTKVHPFTDDLKAFDSALQQIQASGGGDYPESVNQGLDQAVSRMQWSKGTAKLVFLVGDAPPHMDYQGDVRYVDSAVGAVARGIKIHSIAASGLEPKGSPSFRQVAQLTRGKFIFIEYGGDIKASAAKHGVGGPVKSNNLDDIVFEQIKAEIDVWTGRAG